jgi:D-hydroxyproline dehydrogenase subunit beta
MTSSRIGRNAGDSTGRLGRVAPEPPASPSRLPAAAPHVDLVVVGAGMVGLAHAWHASRAGMSVRVIERDERAVGASIRNFGHICTTAQDGVALEYARVAREVWLQASTESGFGVRTDGTVVLARTDAELAVLEEFAARRGADEVRLLTAGEAADRVGFAAPGLRGGAHLPFDLRVNSPDVVPALTRTLVEDGVDIRFGENVLEVAEGLVRTTRGEHTADRVVVSVGHDVDRLFPDLASESGVLRCRLRMLEIDTPRGIRIDPAVFTGSSLLRYGGFSSTDAADAVRAELASTDPDLVAAGVNLMCTQRPDGRIVIGDTHTYETTLDPFDDESADVLLLDRFSRLFGADDLVVRRRWRGVYASSERSPYLAASPLPGVDVASVTSGIGMTTAFGFARAVLDRSALRAGALAG